MALIDTLQAAPQQVLPAGAEERKRRSRIADALLLKSIDTSPVQSWTQGAARVMQALVGGSIAGGIGRDANAEQQRATDLLMNLPGLTGSLPPAAPGAMSAATPVNMSKTGMFDPGDTEMQAGLMTPVKYQPDVLDAAKTSGIDPLMLARQLKQESGFDPNAVSPKGATGVSQFMPATAAERGINPADPSSAIPGGANYLAELKKQFGGNDKFALMAYNWGPGNVRKWLASGSDPNGVPAETRDYVARILGPGGAPQAPAQSMQAPQGGAGIDPQVAATVRALLANPQTRAMGMQLYGKFATPTQYGFQTLPDGTVVRTDPRHGSVTPVMRAPKNPTYGVINQDQYGNKQYGWIDPATRETTPGQAASTPSMTQPTADGAVASAIPPPPPGVDPKEYRKEKTKLLVGQEAATGQRRKYADVVTTDIDRTLDLIEKSPNTTTGPIGNVLQHVPGTSAFNAAALADTIKANVGFDRLQEMRNASPTGGALGQVSEMENRLLQSTIGNLALSQSREQLVFNLKRVRDIYSRIVNQGISPDQAKREMESLGSGAENRTGTPPAVGHVEDGYRFKGGDASKAENWERAQ